MKIYAYDEALNASVDYFQGDELAASVFVSKYALRNSNGELLERTPTDMHRRLAKEFARIEAKYPNPLSEKEIFCLLANVDHLDSLTITLMSIEQLAEESRGFGTVIPQGSPMSAMGNPYKVQSLSNCFVIDSPQDSYGGILFTDQEQAQIMKRRGGVGFDISTIRPRGLTTANAAGTTDGIGIFMERFSNTCREVAQGGRRGALMLSISCSHPEIETFINIKQDLKKVTGANVSIRLSDDFMVAVKSDSNFTLQWPVDVPLDQAKVTKVVKARDIWEQIVNAAWTSAEPGILFWDTIKRNTPTEAYASVGYGSTSVNPCAELILSPYDSCRLLLVNLTKFVDDQYLPSASFNFEKFKRVSSNAQKLMDDLVDLEIEAVDTIIQKIESDPETIVVKRPELELWQKIKKAASGARRTGLGITGLGDALASMNVRYGSQESIEKTEKIYRDLALSSYRSSVDMARDRGSFPVYDWNLENKSPFLKMIMSEDSDLFIDWMRYGRRNIAITTTAPAGSTSCVTQTTSGIEPAYLLSYMRRKKINPDDKTARVDFIDQLGDRWQEYKIYHHGFKKWMAVTGKSDECVVESPYWKATSNDVDWPMSVKLQAAAQKWVCHAISKTSNFPSDVSRDVISDVYMKAWESGCKGFTVYRDGCRSGVLVADTSKTKTSVVDVNGQPKTMVESHAPKRPKELSCDIHRINIRSSGESESYLVLIGRLDDKPYEIFCGLSQHVEIPKKYKSGMLIRNGKKDGLATYNLQIAFDDEDCLLFKDVVELFANPNYGAFTRSLSLSLRHGIPVQYIVEQLQKDKYSDMQSFSKAIGRVLKSYIPDGTKSNSDKVCSSCGVDGLVYREGCVTCVACSWSKC